jgi:hypothetical protein
MAHDKPRTCGQIFVGKLNRKIWVHARKGEDCGKAKQRVAEKWGASPQEVSPEETASQDKGT